MTAGRTDHTKFAARDFATGLPAIRDEGCAKVCQQAEAYGIWPEHHCKPYCIFSAPPLKPIAIERCPWDNWQSNKSFT